MIEKEEWRNLVMEKHRLIQEHNQVKSALMQEISNLRKALNPSKEKAYDCLKRSEDIRLKQEEELVQAHIMNDNYKTELAELRSKLKDMEFEKNLLELELRDRDGQVASLEATIEDWKSQPLKVAYSDSASNSRRGSKSALQQQQQAIMTTLDDYTFQAQPSNPPIDEGGKVANMTTAERIADLRNKLNGNNRLGDEFQAPQEHEPSSSLFALAEAPVASNDLFHYSGELKEDGMGLEYTAPNEEYYPPFTTQSVQPLLSTQPIQKSMGSRDRVPSAGNSVASSHSRIGHSMSNNNNLHSNSSNRISSDLTIYQAADESVTLGVDSSRGYHAVPDADHYYMSTMNIPRAQQARASGEHPLRTALRMENTLKMLGPKFAPNSPGGNKIRKKFPNGVAPSGTFRNVHSNASSLEDSRLRASRKRDRTNSNSPVSARKVNMSNNNFNDGSNNNNRSTSPQRFMQSTNAWATRSTAAKIPAYTWILKRNSGGWKWR